MSRSTRNINWPPRRVAEVGFGDTLMDWNRAILRTANTPADAGNVGGTTIREGLENYFFNDDPAFTSPTIVLYNIVATKNLATALDSFNVGYLCYIEEGFYYDLSLHLKLTPNSETEISLRRIEDEVDNNIMSTDNNEEQHTIQNYINDENDYTAYALVGDQGTPKTIHSNEVGVRKLPPILHGISTNESLTLNEPYDLDFQRVIKKITTGGELELTLDGDLGYHYLLVPDSLPLLQHVVTNGDRQDGAWQLPTYENASFENDDAEQSVTRGYRVYRTVFMVSPEEYVNKFIF